MCKFQCQNNFLLNRQYDEIENCIEYTCNKSNLILKIDCINITTDNICNMDKKAYKSIQHYCQECNQKSHQQDNYDK